MKGGPGGKGRLGVVNRLFWGFCKWVKQGITSVVLSKDGSQVGG